MTNYFQTIKFLQVTSDGMQNAVIVSD